MPDHGAPRRAMAPTWAALRAVEQGVPSRDVDARQRSAFHRDPAAFERPASLRVPLLNRCSSARPAWVSAGADNALVDQHGRPVAHSHLAA